VFRASQRSVPVIYLRSASTLGFETLISPNPKTLVAGHFSSPQKPGFMGLETGQLVCVQFLHILTPFVAHLVVFD